jgi:hypothetical protein
MSKRESSRKTRRGRSRDVNPLVWLAAISVVIVALLILNALQRGAFATPPEPSRSDDPAELLSLAKTGQPLWGGHDMSLIPEQLPTPREAPADTPVPRLDMPSTSYDFGRIYEAWDVTHTFAVQNTGDADLLIGNLVTSCGCTTAELSSNVIPPGHRADLTVTFDADYHPTNGPVLRLVWFATNDPTRPWIEVRVTADVQ